MPECPNCGRSAMRTKDWVCQWCGYPLLSRSYKALDKTYKELQEEQKAGWKSVSAEPAPDFDIEPGDAVEPVVETSVPDPEPAPIPEPAPRPNPHPTPQPEKVETPPPAATPEPEPPAPAHEELEAGPPPESAPVMETESEPMITPPPPAREPVLEIEAEPHQEPVITPPPVPEPEQQPEPMITPPPAPAPEAEKAPEPESSPQPEPQPVPEPFVPAAEAALEPSPDTVTNGTQLTVDQLNELFAEDRRATSTTLQGKTILVRGQVSKVFVRDHIDVRYIILDGLTSKASWSVRCVFEKSAVSQLTRLEEGREVTVKGLYDGFSKNIILKNCSLA